MQPQDPMQPQQPIQPPQPPQQVVPSMPNVAMPQPVMSAPPQPQMQPMPQQPMQPNQQYGMPMQPLPKNKRFSVKKLIILAAIVIAVGAGVFVGLTMLKNPYPKYKESVKTSYNGFSIGTFEGWVKKDESKSSQKTVTYTDYVDDKKKDDKNVHAQQVVVIQNNVVPKSQLTAAVKQEFIAQFTQKQDFFDGLGDEIDQCTTLEEKNVKSVDTVSIKKAFVVIDFSFSCPEKDTSPGIKAIGRLILTDDGSLAVSLIAATKNVYEKNQAFLETAALSIVKE